MNKEEVNEELENQNDETQECCEEVEVEQEANEKQEEKAEKSQEEIILELEEKLKESEDKYLRVHADFENIKKRLEKEKYQAIDYASERFAKDLLTPIDSLEMALASASGDLEAKELLEKLKEGIDLTVKSFYTAFEKHDISVVDTDGAFDPNFHDAVMQVDSPDHQNGEIVQQLQKGYRLKERLLRPAMVSICKK